MRKILFLMLFYTACDVNAQFALQGIVRSKPGNEALPGVSVYFPDLKTGTLSKADGSYQLQNLPKIKTLVQVRLLGYKTFVKTIDLSVQDTLDIYIEESVVETHEVVITGTSMATEVKRSPVPMTTIDQKYLTQNTATNIIDAMVKVPGLSAISSGPNVSKPVIRGLGFNRILTLYDGIRQEGQQWGDEHGIETDQYLIDRVEVVKGPASLIYGSDALAGVVNLLPANPLPEGTVKGSATTNYQSNNGLYAASANCAGHLKGMIWGTRASYKQATNYQNKYDGRVYNTAFNEKDVNAYIGINRSWGYSHLDFTLFDNQQEIPDGYRDSLTRKFVKQITEADTFRPIVSDAELRSYHINPIHQRVQHYRLFSSNNFYFGKSKISARFSYQQSIRREYAHPQAPAVPGLFLKLNTLTYDVKYYLPEKNGWEATIGANGMVQFNNTDAATEFVIPAYSLLDMAPFVYIRKMMEKWELSVGARYDTRMFHNSSLYTTSDPVSGFDKIVSGADTLGATHVFSEYRHVFSGFSGSAGASYNITEGLLLKLNVARGFRAPNISEISAKGIHPGTGFEQLGDASFKPEFSLQEDAGLFYENEHISASAEVFNNNISNYIFNEKLHAVTGGDSLVYQAGAPYPVFKFRQTQARLYGGEIRIDIHPHPFDWLHIENTVSMVYALNQGSKAVQVSDSTRYLPYIPPFHSNSEIRAEFKKGLACFKRAFIKCGVQYYAAQNRAFLAYGTETSTPSYILLDAGMGADVVNRKGETLFTLSALATNLGDLAYQNNMSRLKYFDNYPVNGSGRSGIYSMGRNISIKLTVPFYSKK